MPRTFNQIMADIRSQLESGNNAELFNHATMCHLNEIFLKAAVELQLSALSEVKEKIEELEGDLQ